MQPIFGNIIWVSNSIYRPKFNLCLQFYLLYIRTYEYTVVVTRRRRDDRRVVLFFYLTYVRIFVICFLLFSFSFIFQSNEFTGSSGQTYDSKNVLYFYSDKINTTYHYPFIIWKKKQSPKRKLRDRVLAGFTLRWGGGVYKGLNPAYGLNPGVFMSVTKYYSTPNSMDTSPKCISCRLLQFLVTPFQEEEKKKKKTAYNKTGYNVLFIA